MSTLRILPERRAHSSSAISSRGQGAEPGQGSLGMPGDGVRRPFRGGRRTPSLPFGFRSVGPAYPARRPGRRLWQCPVGVVAVAAGGGSGDGEFPRGGLCGGESGRSVRGWFGSVGPRSSQGGCGGRCSGARGTGAAGVHAAGPSRTARAARWALVAYRCANPTASGCQWMGSVIPTT